MFFSKWLVFSPSSGPGHVSIARSTTPAAWHMVLHHLALLSVSKTASTRSSAATIPQHAPAALACPTPCHPSTTTIATMILARACLARAWLALAGQLNKSLVGQAIPICYIVWEAWATVVYLLCSMSSSSRLIDFIMLPRRLFDCLLVHFAPFLPVTLLLALETLEVLHVQMSESGLAALKSAGIQFRVLPSLPNGWSLDA